MASLKLSQSDSSSSEQWYRVASSMVQTGTFEDPIESTLDISFANNVCCE